MSLYWSSESAAVTRLDMRLQTENDDIIVLVGEMDRPSALLKEMPAPPAFSTVCLRRVMRFLPIIKSSL